MTNEPSGRDPAARNWDDPDHARAYVAGGADLPHRAEGEAVLIESLPRQVQRVVDLGAGDGRLLAVVLAAIPGAAGIALDHNSAMLDLTRQRFAGRDDLEIVDHDLDRPLPASLGPADAVVSALVVHHFERERRLGLAAEILTTLRPGGVFADLDLVRSASESLHDRFIELVPWERSPEKAWDRHWSVAERMALLVEAGFEHVDCVWRWRELALVVGQRPARDSDDHE